MGIGVTEHKDGSSTVVISGEIFGDNFPSNEIFLTDEKDQGINPKTSESQLYTNKAKEAGDKAYRDQVDKELKNN